MENQISSDGYIYFRTKETQLDHVTREFSFEKNAPFWPNPQGIFFSSPNIEAHVGLQSDTSPLSRRPSPSKKTLTAPSGGLYVSMASTLPYSPTSESCPFDSHNMFSWPNSATDSDHSTQTLSLSSFLNWECPLGGTNCPCHPSSAEC